MCPGLRYGPGSDNIGQSVLEHFQQTKIKVCSNFAGWYAYRIKASYLDNQTIGLDQVHLLVFHPPLWRRDPAASAAMEGAAFGGRPSVVCANQNQFVHCPK